MIGFVCHFFSCTYWLGFRKSTPTQNCQLIVYYYQFKQEVVAFVGELTFCNHLINMDGAWQVLIMIGFVCHFFSCTYWLVKEVSTEQVPYRFRPPP